MDPLIMKKLLDDDEDETMHSGADVINRDVEGKPPSHSAVLSQGSNNTCSQSLPQLHTQDDQKQQQQREVHSYEMQQQRSISEKNHALEELNPYSVGQGQGESQYAKLQKMSNQQAMTTGQPSAPVANPSKQIQFVQLLPVLLPQLDKDRAMQVTTLFAKLKKNEIRKDAFVRHIKNVVGEKMLKMAVHKVQPQPSLKHQLMPQASVQQQTLRMPSISAGATQLTDPHTFALHQRGANHSVVENNAKKLREAGAQSDSNSMQVNQMSSSSSGAANQEVELSSIPMQLHNKQQQQQQQQQLHYPQSSFAMYGSTGSNCRPYSGATVNTLPLKQQPHDSQLRPIIQHQSMGSAQSGGMEARRTNIMRLPKLERQNSLEKPSSRTGFSASGTMMPSSSTSTVPLNPVSSSTAMQADPYISSGSRVHSGISVGVNNRIASKKPSAGQKKPNEALCSSPPPSSKKQKVSEDFAEDSLDQSIEQLNDVTAVSGVNLREEEEQMFSGPKDNRASEASRKVMQEEEESLILQKIPLQKKLAEIILRKCGLKSISNDVERCLSLCVEEKMRGLINSLIRLSKQRVDAEKPKHHTITTSDLQKQIMSHWEKKRAEPEKVRKFNEPEVGNGVDGDKYRDSGCSKSLKVNKEKDDKMRTSAANDAAHATVGGDDNKSRGSGRSKSLKVNKEVDDKLRTTAANVAARAAVGGDDVLSKWQLMAEVGRQKRQGGTDIASGSEPGKDLNCKPTSGSGRILKDNQEAEKRVDAESGKKIGQNQVMAPPKNVARRISVKDLISVLEREPQMSKSPLIYRLYERNQSDSAAGDWCKI